MTILYPAARWSDAVDYIEKVQDEFKDKFYRRARFWGYLDFYKFLFHIVYAGLAIGFLVAYIAESVEHPELGNIKLLIAFLWVGLYFMTDLLIRLRIHALIRDMARFLQNKHVYYTFPSVDYLRDPWWFKECFNSFHVNYTRSLGNLDLLKSCQVVQASYDGRYIRLAVAENGFYLKELRFDCPDGIEDFHNLTRVPGVIDLRYLDKYFFWMPTKEEKGEPIIYINF